MCVYIYIYIHTHLHIYIYIRICVTIRFTRKWCPPPSPAAPGQAEAGQDTRREQIFVIISLLLSIIIKLCYSCFFIDIINLVDAAEDARRDNTLEAGGQQTHREARALIHI